MSLITRAWLYAMLSLYVWFASSHTLIHTAENDKQEEGKGEGS